MITIQIPASMEQILVLRKNISEALPEQYRELTFKAELITEELLTHFLPFTGPINFRIFVDESKQLAVEVEQENYDQPIIDSPTADEISLMILQGLCRTLTETQEGNNRLISLEVGDPNE